MNLFRSWKFLGPLGLAVVLSGCVALEEDAETSGEAQTFQVGALLPLSGDGATYGLPAQRVAQYAAEKANAEGKVKLEFIFEDGGCNSDTANRAIQKLVNVDKVKIIYGGFCSSVTLAAAPVVEQNKVVLLSPSSQGEVLATYAWNKGYKKVGVLSEAQPYTEGIRDVFKAEFEGFGGTVVSESYLSDASDFRTQILKLKGGEVDAYFVNPQTSPKGELIFKQMEEAEVKGPFIANDVVLGFTELVTKYKDLLEGAVGAEATYDRNSPEMAEMQKWYKETYQEDLPYLTYMATSYDAVFIIKEAIEKVGYDAENIKNFLYEIKDRKGLAGSLTMDENGDPKTGHILRAVKNGAVEDYKE